MRFNLFLTLFIISGASNAAGVPIRDFAGLINESTVVAVIDIPFENNYVGRLTSAGDCSYDVSVQEEPDTSFFGNLFGLSHYFLNINTVSCNHNGETLSLNLNNRMVSLTKPVSKGSQLTIPSGTLDIIELIAAHETSKQQ